MRGREVRINERFWSLEFGGWSFWSLEFFGGWKLGVGSSKKNGRDLRPGRRTACGPKAPGPAWCRRVVRLPPDTASRSAPRRRHLQVALRDPLEPRPVAEVADEHGSHRPGH